MSYLLLVDDDVDGREPLRRFLEHAGHEVACAGNGEQALRSILVRTPDAIILDLFMPHMDGVKFMEVVRSYLRLQSLRIVILTAFPESPLVKRAQELAATRVLAKSRVSLKQIEEAVRADLASPPDDRSPSNFKSW
jgi:CheY-like chemotaxis protein